jgi:hypothetical protein
MAPAQDQSMSSEDEDPILQASTPQAPVKQKVILPKPPIDHPDNPKYQRRSKCIANNQQSAHAVMQTPIQQANYEDPKFKPRRFRDMQKLKFRQ